MKVHFLGIGGSGASAAAAIAASLGFTVNGCDLNPHNEFTIHFKSSQLMRGHQAKHLDKIDIIAVTPAIFSLDPNNPELLAAKEKGIPVMTWQQFVGEYLAKEKYVIAVCGTHGKTTTTAMIAQVLEDSGKDPIVLLGAIHPEWKANYRVGKRELALSDGERGAKRRAEPESNGYFVIEADEFNDNFLHLHPNITVVTNIEMDHPEYFENLDAVKISFKKFLQQTKGTIVANLSDPVVKKILASHLRGGNKVLDYSKKLIDFNLKIPGQFNQLNTQAAYQVALLLKIDPITIRKSLESYTGVGKRFEYLGDYLDTKIYSDFGHHPTEIKVTMGAARQKFPDQRILLVYQPHMFSRTKALFADFVKVFRQLPVDKAFIMDIYPSREIDTGLVTSQQLVEAVKRPNVKYIGKTSDTLEKLKPEIKKGDILFFMSAGDTDKLARDLLRQL